MQKSTVGIIGLGIIGSRIANVLRNAEALSGGDALRAKSFDVRVWSRTPRVAELGWMNSPLELIKSCNTVQVFVRDAEALQSCVDDMLPGLGAGKTLINCSTVSVEAIQSVAEQVKNTGADFLDCPFTGSRDAAALGQLTYYVGGDHAAIERARPFLEPTAKLIVPCGAIGAATVLKLATNMVSAITVQALAEGLGVVSAQGIAPQLFLQAMQVNANCSLLVQMKLPSMIAGDFAPHFSLNNMLKDVRYAQSLAEQHALALPTLTAAAEQMDKLVRSGQGDQDYSVLAADFLCQCK